MAERQVSVGSLIELEAHTEQAHSPCRPDHLLLGCLRGDPTAVTFVWTARQVLDCLTDVEIALAREPLWMTGVDESFRHDGVDFKLGDIRGPMPILYGDSADPFMVVDQDLMHGTTNAASALLAHVVRAFTVRRKGIVLQPGDLLVVDNRRTMHGRSSFVPKFDGCDRFVLRCFTCHDLGRLREARPDGSRTVAAAFS